MALDRGKLTVYLNGEYTTRAQAGEAIELVWVASAGGFYDHERTFDGKVFRLRDHLERLHRGLAHAKLDPGVTVDQMEAASAKVMELNLPLLQEDDEFELIQVVSIVRSESPEAEPRFNVLISCEPLDFDAFALGYVRGARVVTPATYRAPVSEEGDERRTYPLGLDSRGSVTECKGGNFMFVRDGRIMLPDRRNVLPGVSMQMVLELAKVVGIEVDEGDYSIADVYGADEAFLSATTYCMIPVDTLNGLRIREELMGPVTRRILDAWRIMVGHDFVEKAVGHLPPEARGGA